MIRSGAVSAKDVDEDGRKAIIDFAPGSVWAVCRLAFAEQGLKRSLFTLDLVDGTNPSPGRKGWTKA